MRSNWELCRRVEGRMQAPELAEQRAGCSSAAQPQGGRFPLRLWDHTHSTEHSTCTPAWNARCVENLTTIFGLHNHFAVKSQSDKLFNPRMYRLLQPLYYAISAEQTYLWFLLQVMLKIDCRKEKPALFWCALKTVFETAKGLSLNIPRFIWLFMLITLSLKTVSCPVLSFLITCQLNPKHFSWNMIQQTLIMLVFGATKCIWQHF